MTDMTPDIPANIYVAGEHPHRTLVTALAQAARDNGHTLVKIAYDKETIQTGYTRITLVTRNPGDEMWIIGAETPGIALWIEYWNVTASKTAYTGEPDPREFVILENNDVTGLLADALFSR